MLTIAIPTFNRLEPLLNTLRQLNAQPGVSECEILVVDNASDYALEDLTRHFPALDRLTVRVQRNRGNIGLSGNLLRCMELATSEWVWVLADDDDLCENAVQTILDRVGSAADLDFILFSQEAGQAGGVKVASPREFAEALDSWDRICFISDGIYRTSSARAVLNIGILYGYSVIPFLAMILVGLQDKGWSASFETQVLVRPAHRAESTWAMIWSTHTITVIEVIEDPVAADHLRKLAKTWCVGPIGLTHDYLQRSLNHQQGNSWEAYLHRLFMASRCSAKYRILGVLCFAIASLPPTVSLRIIEQIRSFAGRKARNVKSGAEVFEQA